MYTESLVVFIDLLGFSDFVMTKSFEEVRVVLSEFKNMMKSHDKTTVENINKDIELNIHKGEYISNKLTFLSFSDCIILAYPLDRIDVAWTLINICVNLMPVQFELFKKKLSMRGGIALGNIYMADDYVFGGGLVESAILEKEAKYPRILIHENVIEKLISQSHILDEWIISKDTHYYLDIFKYLKSSELWVNKDNKTWQSIRDERHASLRGIIEYGIKNQNTEIVKKYQWLKDKYEFHFKN